MSTDGEKTRAAAHRRGLGAYGEGLAERFLRARGYQVLVRNYRTRFGEVDLIAREGDDLVFVEVRTRRGAGLGSPEESLTPAKLRRLVRVSESYLQEQSQAGEDCSWRIDVVAIQIDGRGKVESITLHTNAVELG